MARMYRDRAARIPEEAARLGYNPEPSIREMVDKAALYEACAKDVRDMPDEDAQVVARKFRSAMWARDQWPDREPDDFHP
jgi:thioredoxin-like negative regulator of GroEL